MGPQGCEVSPQTKSTPPHPHIRDPLEATRASEGYTDALIIVSIATDRFQVTFSVRSLQHQSLGTIKAVTFLTLFL